MPKLKNARHELFAQGMAKGLVLEEAYSAAGFKPHRGNAFRLSTKEHVLARIDELQSKVAKKVEVTVESLAIELEEARAIAIEEKQTSAAVSASMGKAKLFGLGKENRHHSGSIQIITLSAKDLEGLSTDELATLEKAYPILQNLGLVGGDTSSEAGTRSQSED